MHILTLAALFCAGVHGRIVTITGASGRTGALVYHSLKEEGITVRAAVRNLTKAKQTLGCNKCDESEGIFASDVTNQSSLKSAMTDADTLVIATGPAYKCAIPSMYIGCKFLPGADPKTMAWQSVKSQISVFALSAGSAITARHVILLSNDLTTVPDNFLDKIDNSQSCFYALNGEAFAMSSGIPFTIIKPNGLNDGPAGKKELLVAHDDQGWSPLNPNTAFISRGDVARLLTYAAMNPERTKGLRFDVTSKQAFGTPTADVSKVFEAARLPWQAQPIESRTIV
eukprot:TRINITY_DN52580_c0_g1_i1.p1 TRINITY_DN52580_c0_g1~~TRINITY_DN52580_c0_g1_i1.p1  ORF type:complete len:284 (-),score=56.99 TRINITY_DN52580_c0_g1_i1:42-893(-)